MSREFRVSHAEIRLEGLGASGSREYFRSALDQSWVPGTHVTRYTRTWRLARWVKPEEGLWLGHMGFVKEGDLATVNWDDKTMDFVRGEASRGLVVPFLISDKQRIVSFQLIPGEIRPTTITSNLQALLSKEGTHLWSIRQMSLRTTLEHWLDTVDGVSTINLSVRLPNPTWTGRERVQGIVEELRAEIVRLRARAIANGSIDTDSDLIRQALDHVRLGYGGAVLTGPDVTTGQESKFIETADGGCVDLIDQVAVSDDSAEVTADDLKGLQDRLIDSYAEREVVSRATDEELND